MTKPRQTRTVSALLTTLFFLSGLTGVVYQVLWVRRFTHVMGSSAISVSVVIAAFMGGLFIGAVLLSRALPACRSELRWYSVLEAGIGLWALIFAAGFPMVGIAYGALADILPGWITKSAMSAVLLLPPTAAMGATLPLMVQYTQRQGLTQGFGQTMGWIYAVNTAGGAVGAVLAGFVLIEFVGIDTSLMLMAALNVTVAAAAWWIASSGAPAAEPQPLSSAPQRTGKTTPATGLLLAAFASGAAAIGCEVLWTRGLKFVIQSSTYSYALILGTFLIGLGLGGAAYGRLATRVNQNLLYGRLQCVVGVWALLSVILLYSAAPTDWVQSVLLSLVYDSGHHWGLGLAVFGLVCLVVLLPPTLAMGMSFPALNTLYHERTGSAAGTSVSTVFAGNTLGSICGALGVGFLLLPAIGIRGALFAMAAVSLALGWGFLWPLRRREVLISAAICLALLWGGQQGVHLLGRGELPTDRVLFYDEGLMSTVKVYQRSNNTHMSIDGARIASTARGLRQKEQLVAHLPALLRPELHNVLAVGLASGITAHSISLHDDVRRIDIVELVEPVFEASRLFAAHNGDILADARVRLIHDDVYAWLQRTDLRYDAIVSDGKLGSLNNANTVLLSRDYYQQCRRRMQPHGIFVQWVPIITPEQELRTILRTAAASFEHVGLFYFYSSDIMIVASPSPLRLDAGHMQQVFQQQAVARELADLDLASPAAILSCYLGAYALADSELPANTFDRPYLEFAYLRDWKKGRAIPGGYRARNMALLVENLVANDGATLAAAFPGLPPDVVERVLRLPALEFYGHAMANFRGGSYGRGLQAWRQWKQMVTAALFNVDE